MLGPAAEEIGEYFRLRIRGYLSTNRDRIVARAAQMVELSGRNAHEVPLRTALPLLEGACREDDPTLQERWAALLANASTADRVDAVPPVFAEILSNLTPSAARVLDLLNEQTSPRRGESYGFLEQAALQEEGGLVPDQLTLAVLGEIDFDNIDLFEAEKQDVMALVDLLIREGLVSMVPIFQHDREAATIRSTPISPISQAGLDIRITHLGQKFLLACTSPGA
jgi:hypothetical protein